MQIICEVFQLACMQTGILCVAGIGVDMQMSSGLTLLFVFSLVF